jgi:hypothetical protein
MKLKIIACLLILAVAIGAGCSGQQAEPEEQEAQPDDTEAQEADPEVVDTPTGEPELKIMDANIRDDQIELVIKNVGDATAEDVYIGSIAFQVSNKKAYEKYVTGDDFSVMSDAIEGGLTEEVFEYETTYSYNGTPNMTFYYWLDTSGYVGDISSGEVVTRSMINVRYMPVENVEKAFIVWMDGQEDEFVLY